MHQSDAPAYRFTQQFRAPCPDPVGLDRFLRDVLCDPEVDSDESADLKAQPMLLATPAGFVPVFEVDDYTLARQQMERLGYPCITQTATEFWVQAPGGMMMAIVPSAKKTDA